MGWVWLVNPAGVPHRVNDHPEALGPFVGRDWVATDIPGEFNSDDEEFAAALAKWQASQESVKSTAEAKSATEKKKEVKSDG